MTAEFDRSSSMSPNSWKKIKALRMRNLINRKCIQDTEETNNDVLKQTNTAKIEPNSK
jgi:hypothetical protein